MNVNTIMYLSLAQKLQKSITKESASNFRRRAQVQMLQYLVRATETSSGYLCQYDPHDRSGTVINEYSTSMSSISINQMTDVGGVYEEESMGVNLLNWLNQTDHSPRILHADELPEDDIELAELKRGDAKTVLFLPVYSEGSIWGWTELWEKRRKRNFNSDQLTIAQQITDCLAHII